MGGHRIAVQDLPRRIQPSIQDDSESDSAVTRQQQSGDDRLMNADTRETVAEAIWRADSDFPPIAERFAGLPGAVQEVYGEMADAAIAAYRDAS